VLHASDVRRARSFECRNGTGQIAGWEDAVRIDPGDDRASCRRDRGIQACSGSARRIGHDRHRRMGVGEQRSFGLGTVIGGADGDHELDVGVDDLVEHRCHSRTEVGPVVAGGHHRADASP
jgi:hypothetical protein